MTEEQIVKETFQKYSDAFEKLDPKVIVPFYYLPSMLIPPSQDPVAMSTEDLVQVVFQQFFNDLRKVNYKRSRLDTLHSKLLSDNMAMVSGTAKWVMVEILNYIKFTEITTQKGFDLFPVPLHGLGYLPQPTYPFCNR